MKLIIQIPCYNEEETLPVTLKDLPRKIEGIDEIEWLVINDGSRDNTVKIAKANGVDHVLDFKNNQGLARVFTAGLEKCIELGADIIVNTDADNQYCGADIEKLVKPILENNYDMVIGERPISEIEHFSFHKKVLQKLGSWTVRMASNTKVPDAPSGFRAIRRSAAMKFNVFNQYTYTLETIIQAGQTNMAITSVPIRVNGDLRPSKLVKSISSYVILSIETIFGSLAIYNPFKVFLSLSLFFLSIGIFLGIRWILLLFVYNASTSHIPSLVFASISVTISVMLFSLGIISHLISVNRQLLEDIQLKQRKNGSNTRR